MTDRAAVTEGVQRALHGTERTLVDIHRVMSDLLIAVQKLTEVVEVNKNATIDVETSVERVVERLDNLLRRT